MNSTISIKGTRDGLTITLASSDIGQLIGDLAAHLATQGAFFRGGKVALRVDEWPVTTEELTQVRDLLAQHEMMLRTVITADTTTEAAAHTLGLHVVSAPRPTEAPVDAAVDAGPPVADPPAAQPSVADPPAAQPRGPSSPLVSADAGRRRPSSPLVPPASTMPAHSAAPAKGRGDARTPAPPHGSTATTPAPVEPEARTDSARPPSSPPQVLEAPATEPAAVSPVAEPRAGMPIRSSDGERALFVRRQVRAGQVVRHTGPVVVMGDVNPSGEIWAGGDVIVWGRLRGRVRAGLAGEGGAVVCALDLSPAQLMIGEVIGRSADDERDRARPYPEVARVSGGAIVVEPWKPGGRGA